MGRKRAEEVESTPVVAERRPSVRPINQIIDEFWHTCVSHPDFKALTCVWHGRPNSAQRFDDNTPPSMQHLVNLSFVWKESMVEQAAKEVEDPYAPGGRLSFIVTRKEEVAAPAKEATFEEPKKKSWENLVPQREEREPAMAE